MKRSQILLKRYVVVQAMVFILIFGAVGTAHAQGIVYGDQIPEGQVIENDAVLFGDTVMIDGTVEGDVVAAGRNININGTINGSLIAIGESISINGGVNGTVYSASVTLELGESSVMQRNVYFVGLDLIQQSGSQIERDLVVASLIGAALDGSVARNTRGVFGPSAFIRLIIDAAGGQFNLPGLTPSSFNFDKAKLGITGVSMSNGGMRSAATGFLLGGVTLSDTMPGQSGGPGARIDTEMLGEWLENLLREYVVLLVFGFLGLWLFSPNLNHAVEALGKRPLPAVGYGLVALVFAVNLFFVGGLLAVIILIIGVWMGIATLWELAFAFWAVGFSSTALAMSLFWLFVNYGTKIIVAFLIGKLILGLITPKATGYRMVSLLLGLLIYVLLHSISLLGWVIGVIFTTLGLGALVVMYLDRRLHNGTEVAAQD